MSLSPAKIESDKVLFAMLCVLAAMFIACGSDLATKWVSDRISIWQLALMRSIIGASILCAFVLVTKKRGVLKAKNGAVVLIRSLLMAVSFLTYFIAIGVLPIAIVAAGLFSSPIFTVIFSQFLLQERVGAWRSLSALAGFAGVLLVLQPDTNDLNPALLWPLGCGFAYALTNIYTRKYCKAENPLALSFWLSIVFAVIGLAGLLWLALQASAPGPSSFVTHPLRVPDGPLLVAIIGIGIGSIVMHFFLASAYQSAPTSLLAPLEYIYLPMATLGGIWFFAEKLSALAYVGIAVIILSGIVIAWREQALGRLPKHPPTGRAA